MKKEEKIAKKIIDFKKVYAEKCSRGEHEISRELVGGFPGHEHVHPTGDQICLYCKKSLSQIIKEIIEDAYWQGVQWMLPAFPDKKLVAKMGKRWKKDQEKLFKKYSVD